MMKKMLRARASLTTLPFLGGWAAVDPQVLTSLEALAIALISVAVDWLGGN